MTCLAEETRVLRKLRSDVSDGAVGHEFDVSESTVVLNKVSLNGITHKEGYIQSDLILLCFADTAFFFFFFFFTN